MSQFLKILLNIFYIISGLYPFIWLSGVFIFTLRVWIYLGYWPQPNKPDPQFVPFEFYRYILAEMFSYLVLSSIIFIIFRLQKKITLLNLKFFKHYHIISWVLIFVFFLVPKINFVAWIID